MDPLLQKALFTVALTGFFVGSGLASPLSKRLLPLVPPGADIVAGFENFGAPSFHGHLLLTTHNNRLDLEDFQSLTAVDNQRVFDEAIEVAARSPEGTLTEHMLTEHMLLVSGRFDRERIFSSMELNGAQNSEYQGERVSCVKPLSRERGDMLDTRWMVILDSRTGIFGTPELVRAALRRHAQHAAPDSILEERLSLLRRDVTTWNILVGSETSQKNISFAQPYNIWAQLQQDADVLMVAAHFGSKIRVDFSIHADAGHGPEFFTRKAALFADALVAEPTPESTAPDEAQRRLQNFSLESNRVQGSVELSKRQFAAWCEYIFMARVGMVPATTTGD